MYTSTLSRDRLAFPNGIEPQSLNNARLNSGSVDMSKSKRAVFVLYCGANSAGSISAWLQESADDSSWTANDTAGAFSGGGGTQVSATGITTANSITTFEVRADMLTSGKRYVRIQIKETASAAVLVCVVVLGGDTDHKPASALNGTHQATNGAEYVVA